MFVRKAAAAVVMLAALGTATPALGADQPITANTTVAGRLEPGDTRRDGYFVDTYVYNGEAGEELYLGSNFPMEITGPNRFSQQTNRFDSTVLIRLPTSGRYRIAVVDVTYASYQESRSYELNILQLNTTRNPTTLEVGQTINGSFSLDDSVDGSTGNRRFDTYTYNAAAGEVVGILVQSVGTEAELYVSGPSSGLWTFGNADYAYFGAAGEHQIRVVGGTGREAGNYTLTVVRGQFADVASPTRALALGEAVVVAVEPDVVDEDSRPTGTYTIDAHRGDRLAVMTTRSPGQTRVIGPDGSRVSGQTNRASGSASSPPSTFVFEAPADGQYRIQVSFHGRDIPVSLRVLSAADGTAALANWETDRIARIVDLTRRGEQLLSSGANEEATVVLQEILSLDWRNVFAHISLGNLEYRRGELVNARHHFRSAAEDDPNNQSAQNGLRLVQEAELARERNWQQQQEHWARQRAQWAAQQAQADRERQQRDAAAIGNAIGVFTGVYNATVEAQRQADAQARAQAEAQARAQADAQAAQQQAQVATRPAPPPPPPAQGEQRVSCVVARYDQLQAEYFWHNNCSFSVRVYARGDVRDIYGSWFIIAGGGRVRLGTGATPADFPNIYAVRED